jgi:hypothetical protein
VRTISFVYRARRAEKNYDLRHELTHDQFVALDRMEQYAHETLLRCDARIEGNDQDYYLHYSTRTELRCAVHIADKSKTTDSPIFWLPN